MAKSRLTKAQVKHIAKLANLSLSEKEITLFQKQLSQVLNYVKILNKLDTAKVKPTSQVTGLENVFKEDKTSSSLSQKEALSGAKAKSKGYFKIKAIFE